MCESELLEQSWGIVAAASAPANVWSQSYLNKLERTWGIVAAALPPANVWSQNYLTKVEVVWVLHCHLRPCVRSNYTKKITAWSSPGLCLCVQACSWTCLAGGVLCWRQSKRRSGTGEEEREKACHGLRWAKPSCVVSARTIFIYSLAFWAKTSLNIRCILTHIIRFWPTLCTWVRERMPFTRGTELASYGVVHIAYCVCVFMCVFAHQGAAPQT